MDVAERLRAEFGAADQWHPWNGTLRRNWPALDQAYNRFRRAVLDGTEWVTRHGRAPVVWTRTGRSGKKYFRVEMPFATVPILLLGTSDVLRDLDTKPPILIAFSQQGAFVGASGIDRQILQPAPDGPGKDTYITLSTEGAPYDDLGRGYHDAETARLISVENGHPSWCYVVDAQVRVSHLLFRLTSFTEPGRLSVDVILPAMQANTAGVLSLTKPPLLPRLWDRAMKAAILVVRCLTMGPTGHVKTMPDTPQQFQASIRYIDGRDITIRLTWRGPCPLAVSLASKDPLPSFTVLLPGQQPEKRQSIGFHLKLSGKAGALGPYGNELFLAPDDPLDTESRERVIADLISRWKAEATGSLRLVRADLAGHSKFKHRASGLPMTHLEWAIPILEGRLHLEIPAVNLPSPPTFVDPVTDMVATFATDRSVVAAHLLAIKGEFGDGYWPVPDTIWLLDEARTNVFRATCSLFLRELEASALLDGVVRTNTQEWRRSNSMRESRHFQFHLQPKDIRLGLVATPALGSEVVFGQAETPIEGHNGLDIGVAFHLDHLFVTLGRGDADEAEVGERALRPSDGKAAHALFLRVEQRPPRWSATLQRQLPCVDVVFRLLDVRNPNFAGRFDPIPLADEVEVHVPAFLFDESPELERILRSPAAKSITESARVMNLMNCLLTEDAEDEANVGRGNRKKPWRAFARPMGVIEVVWKAATLLVVALPDFKPRPPAWFVVIDSQYPSKHRFSVGFRPSRLENSLGDMGNLGWRIELLNRNRGRKKDPFAMQLDRTAFPRGSGSVASLERISLVNTPPRAQRPDGVVFGSGTLEWLCHSPKSLKVVVPVLVLDGQAALE